MLSDLIYRSSGIKLNPLKKGLLIARLSKRIKLVSARGFYDYYSRVKNDSEELVEMLNCISTNTTEFFRERHHFEYFKDHVAVELLLNNRDRVIRIWSAGCSTGEEPYSIALALQEALRARAIHPGTYDIKILATDISTKALDTARAGIYALDQFPAKMPLDILKRYFLIGEKGNGGKIKVKDCLRNIIWFRRLNLKDASYPFQRAFDIIFCRNVMIYFDEHMKHHVFSAFHRHLSDGGFLFLGHAETMTGRSHFRPVYTTVYRKVS